MLPASSVIEAPEVDHLISIQAFFIFWQIVFSNLISRGRECLYVYINLMPAFVRAVL